MARRRQFRNGPNDSLHYVPNSKHAKTVQHMIASQHHANAKLDRPAGKHGQAFRRVLWERTVGGLHYYYHATKGLRIMRA